ncbi:MAG: methyltransferase domain-containing protein [Deltaproteobacteria bacterium]|nr:methyltransferase domain-containing protein [Deltaproteobacteria bacterium]MBW2362073.1 methyltransferase domain-containing protein [Deltaproteobacteria bacterium]
MPWPWPLEPLRRIVTGEVRHSHTCPCCERTARRFLDSPNGQRPGVRCPHCNSRPRHRILHLFLRERTDLFDGQPTRLLHVAPNPRISLQLTSAPWIDYVSADLQRPTAMLKMDITDIQLPDASFDVIICNHVLEHVPEDRRAMRELCRILRPDGWAILQVPLDPEQAETFENPSVTDPEERRRVFGHPGHVRRYGRDYADRLREAGFDVTLDPFVQKLDPAIVERLRLTPQDVYVCRPAASRS